MEEVGIEARLLDMREKPHNLGENRHVADAHNVHTESEMKKTSN
jgi:hypothetical protein